MIRRVQKWDCPDVFEVAIARKPYGEERYNVQVMRSEQVEGALEASLPIMEIAVRSDSDEQCNFWAHAMVPSTPETAEKAGGVLGSGGSRVDGYWATPADCEHACRSYMVNLAMKRAIGTGATVDHDPAGDANGQPLIVPIESVWDKTGDIARALNFKTPVPGAWILGFHVNDSKVWENVKNGSMPGVSPRFRFKSSAPIEVGRSESDFDPPKDKNFLEKIHESLRAIRSLVAGNKADESEEDMKDEDVKAHVADEITRAIKPVNEALSKITETFKGLTETIESLKPAEPKEPEETQRAEDTEQKAEPTEIETMRANHEKLEKSLEVQNGQIELMLRSLGKPSGNAEAESAEKEPEFDIGHYSIAGCAGSGLGRKTRKEGGE